MHDLCCIGHITLDKIVAPKNTVYMAGGLLFISPMQSNISTI